MVCGALEEWVVPDIEDFTNGKNIVICFVGICFAQSYFLDDYDENCHRISCGPPDVPKNATASANDYLFQSIATFHCTVGYNLEGTAQKTCSANKLWEPVVSTMTCAPKDCGIPPQCLQDGITHP